MLQQSVGAVKSLQEKLDKMMEVSDVEILMSVREKFPFFLAVGKSRRKFRKSRAVS